MCIFKYFKNKPLKQIAFQTVMHVFITLNIQIDQTREGVNYNTLPIPCMISIGLSHLRKKINATKQPRECLTLTVMLLN